MPRERALVFDKDLELELSLEREVAAEVPQPGKAPGPAAPGKPARARRELDPTNPYVR